MKSYLCMKLSSFYSKSCILFLLPLHQRRWTHKNGDLTLLTVSTSSWQLSKKSKLWKITTLKFSWTFPNKCFHYRVPTYTTLFFFSSKQLSGTQRSLVGFVNMEIFNVFICSLFWFKVYGKYSASAVNGSSCWQIHACACAWLQ